MHFGHEYSTCQDLGLQRAACCVSNNTVASALVVPFVRMCQWHTVLLPHAVAYNCDGLLPMSSLRLT